MPIKTLAVKKSRHNDHFILKVEHTNYVYFTCPLKQKIEFCCYGPPHHCPVCKSINPIPEFVFTKLEEKYDREQVETFIRTGR